jgi:cell division septation protein DedD
MKIGSYSLLLVAAVIVLAACGKSTKEGPPAAEIPAGRELPSEAPENSVRPDLPEALPPPGVTERLPDTEGKRFGYRVQVAAFTDAEAAENRAGQLRPLFNEPIYVAHEGLLHKVQVGDFVRRDRAEEIRRRAIDLGLDGAFVVDTMINEP